MFDDKIFVVKTTFRRSNAKVHSRFFDSQVFLYFLYYYKPRTLLVVRSEPFVFTKICAERLGVPIHRVGQRGTGI